VPVLVTKCVGDLVYRNWCSEVQRSLCFAAVKIKVVVFSVKRKNGLGSEVIYMKQNIGLCCVW
jgi:hypothetical protein